MVIILNPNDELKIVKFQNEFIKNLGIDDFLCKNFPLWIELPFLTDDLKKENLSQIAKKISNIEIHDFDDFYAKVKIIFEEKEYNSKLKIFEKINLYSHLTADKFACNNEEIFTQKEEFSATQKKLESLIKNTFPLKISVFRLGIEHKISENSFSIKDFVWVKRTTD